MSEIYSKFYSLESEKRERIINASIDEFVRVGFEKASTNEIVKKANISKGSLFSYFNNKKELYLFLFENVIEITEQIYEEMDTNETDIFKRLQGVGLIKFKIIKKYPQAFNFLKAVAQEESTEVKSDIENKIKPLLESGFGRIYQNIDLTKFRDDIDIQKTINIINWTMLSLAEQQRNKLNSFEEISMDLFSEWDSYFDIMKRCFYKKED
ncbi:TetR/AcrR family transcriptional regulator [Rossellomorea sp. BNER]|uniref:TetR/AcrR family transcriptional regulator n=1 Tax=Rossellomorea sp. BNER TaxID=2962031 RepID=UPI003AF2DFD2|nr:TetR/AcrR family transcriptional regulator [Rossellomorea sp. BNER]